MLNIITKKNLIQSVDSEAQTNTEVVGGNDPIILKSPIPLKSVMIPLEKHIMNLIILLSQTSHHAGG